MNNKDTIYIDIDDEITTIIDKLHASDQKIVALVLPKRATVLQSIVNMKLLKRAADQDSKRAVLITSEAGLLPLAGTVGLYVAKSLQTKPEIPTNGVITTDDDEVIDESLEAEEITANTAGDRPVGELAGDAAAAAIVPAASNAIETIELDNSSDSPVADSTGDAKKSDKKSDAKPKRNKRLGVPNFQRFRLLLIIGGVVLLLLIVGGVLAASVLPKASIVVHTDTSNINSNLSISIDTAAKSLNADKLIVPATMQKVDKNGSQQVAATGKKNNGNKASGSVNFSTTCTKKPASVDPGVGVSGGGLTFVTTDTLKFTNIDTDNSGNFVCSGSVPITAQQGGANYNLASGTSFKMASFGYGGTNSNTLSGGTDDIIQVVAQADIDNATQKITAQNSDAVKTQLQQQLKQANLFAIVATFVAGSPNTQSSAQAGDQVSTVTVTQTTTYTMFGVKEADLKLLVDTDIKDKIDTSKQSIQSEGLDKATFKVNSITATNAGLAFATTAVAGPDLQADTVKQQIAGKKSGQVQDTLKANPGVTGVDVKLSPFWVTSVPTKADKVTVTFDKAQ